MSLDVAGNVQGARQLREHGQYADAIKHLERILGESVWDLDLAVELGETLLIQGYFGRATKILEDNLRHHVLPNNLTAIAGEIICCFARFFETSQFKESLRHVESLYHDFSSGGDSKVLNDATVRIETYYCKFWKLVGECGGIDSSHVLRKSLPRLKASFHVLSQQHEFPNAFRVAVAYKSCSKELDADLLLKNLVSNDYTPPLYRAQAQVLLADMFKSQGERRTQDQLYTLALDALKGVEHAHLLLDIEIAMMCRLPLDPDDDTFQERLLGLLKKYEKLDYPCGLGSALLGFQNLLYELSDFESETTVLNELESLFAASDSKLVWLMIRNSTLARWSIRGGDRGKVISGAKALWNDLEKSDCSFFRGQAAQLVSQCYSSLKDLELMVEWSERAQGDLPLTNLTAVPSLARGFDLRKVEELSRYYAVTMKLVDRENADCTPEDAVEKLEVFLGQAMSRPNQTAESVGIIDLALEEYKRHITQLTNAKLLSKHTANLRQWQGSLLILRAASRQDIEFEVAAIDAFKEARGLYLTEKQLGNAVIVLQHEALANISVAQKFERIGDPQAQVAWENALNQYTVALHSTRDLGLNLLSSENAYWVALCKFRQWCKGWCHSESVIDSLIAAEGLVDQQRHEVSILRGVEAAIIKGRLSSNNHVRDIYHFASQVCNRSGNVLGAWNWTQKSKARSLSDLLGLGVLVPAEIEDKIQQNSICKTLFEEEHELMEASRAASNTESFKLRIQLERHQEIMREHAVLAELLHLREGVPISLTDVHNVTGLCHGVRAIVFIDWVIIQSSICVYIVKNDAQPILRELPITIGEIHAWISKHMNSGNGSAASEEDRIPLSGLMEDDDAETGPLRDLDVLVAPLADFSSPQDLLIFCPTGILHSLPLHALRLGPSEEGQILIKRNPITYCASLTSFVQCCRRANVVNKRDIHSKKTLLAFYERRLGDTCNKENYSDDERSRIYSSIKSLAEDYNGESICGENVTYKVFKECLEQSDLVHFHGHCDLDTKIIAEQLLRLYSNDNPTSSSTPSPNIAALTPVADNLAYVTVKDLFDLRIKASHISLIACGSATQQFEAGDEPLGLVAAFLAAGSSSVLGTLWPVQSNTARMFSEGFYHYLHDSGKDEYGVYDLASAVREAVLDVMQPWELRQPYHWASFVLHGTWIFNGEI